MNIQKQILRALLFLALSTSSATAAATSFLATDDLSEVYDLAVKKGITYGNEQVLLVFDIDNTLLATKQNLGSDQWYSWQSSLIKSGNFESTVAKTIPGLLAIQAKLYALSHTQQTQANAATLLQNMQKNGFRVMALTARGPQIRDVTLRELAKHDYSFKESAIGIERGFPGTYLPFSHQVPELGGLTAKEIQRWQLPPARKVSYADGVFMAAGQHKGAMLRTLLHKTKSEFDVIIFVDDKRKNTTHMGEGFAQRHEDLSSVRYTREDGTVEKFHKGPKTKVIRQWHRLSKMIASIFGR